MSETPRTEAQASREMTPDELVEAAEGFANAGGRTITIPAMWPRLILERERAALAHDRPSGSVGLREATEVVVAALGFQLVPRALSGSSDPEAVGLEALRQEVVDALLELDKFATWSALNRPEYPRLRAAVDAYRTGLTEPKPETPA